MHDRSGFLSGFPGLVLTLVLMFLQLSDARRRPSCSPSTCGSVQIISYPFRMKDDPPHCGDRRYQLVCENNTTLMYLDSYRYLVKEINYGNYTIHLADATIALNDTCSFPDHSLSLGPDSPYRTQTHTHSFGDSPVTPTPITFLSCPNPLNSSRFLQIDHCQNRSDRGNASRRHSYVKVGSLYTSDLKEMCTADMVAMTSMTFRNLNRMSLAEIHASLLYGFKLSWFSVRCANCRGQARCWLEGDTCGVIACVNLKGNTIECTVEMNSVGVSKGVTFLLGLLMTVIGLGLAVRITIGLPFLLVLLIYKYRTKHLSKFHDIEGFLQDDRRNNLMPIRYSYSDIKRMTRGFRQKLGAGGYGSVYKGKLHSGHDVAVKVLNNVKSNGQDFINEVGTIGRIHHTNVVKLVGYSIENSTSALVFDFMPNGSLDKYISSQERNGSTLDWKRKHEIAVGVARGIDYLHQGCDIQILHFDIKPHNVLLDSEFNPKVSDFGLAKICSDKNSNVALTAARGTIGYVAPELINRSIGEVSSKADVYSFGMLLMDLVGVKGQTDASSDGSSQYFPDWIYDRLEKRKDVIDDGEDGDGHGRKIRKAMVIVGLWCIQVAPTVRPSMGRVLEMLESEDVELLPVPLKGYGSGQTGHWEYQTVSTDSAPFLYENHIHRSSSSSTNT